MAIKKYNSQAKQKYRLNDRDDKMAAMKASVKPIEYTVNRLANKNNNNNDTSYSNPDYLKPLHLKEVDQHFVAMIQNHMLTKIVSQYIGAEHVSYCKLIKLRNIMIGKQKNQSYIRKLVLKK